ncbi:MAG: HNH endonuclease [Deltaproteobacteria bacterium]
MNADRDALTLAEKVLAILELGSFSATYKYALFTAILDLCMEKGLKGLSDPTVLTTTELAEKVIELYWPHAMPYEGKVVLRQGGGRAGSQAEILRAIEGFRSDPRNASGEILHRARTAHPVAWKRLVHEVEWKLIEMPIPRLQVSGSGEDRFLYEYSWNQDIKRSTVREHQKDVRDRFDNRLTLQPGVAEGLQALNGILRPLLRREWAGMVAAMNGLPESRLEEFLFGASRISLDEVRGPLIEIQGSQCLYCRKALQGAIDVDHFIPWARYPDNGLDNLVAAHQRCNNPKRDFLAAAEHVERWALRNVERAGDLRDVASRIAWQREPGRTRAVAVATYSRLGEGAKVWSAGTSLVGLEKGRVDAALSAWTWLPLTTPRASPPHPPPSATSRAP